MSDVIFAIPHVLAAILAALFAGVALANFIAPHWLHGRSDHARSYFVLMGVLQAATAVFLAVPQIRIWGGILGAMLLFATTVGLLNRGKYARAVPAMLLMVALAPAMV